VEEKKIVATIVENRTEEEDREGMAPQDPGSVNPSLTAGADVGETNTEVINTSPVAATEIESLEEVLKENSKKVDAFQRAETNRKRGWYDYQVLVRGDMRVFNSLCTVPTELTYEGYGVDGWNKFYVSEKENIVNFVVAPASYGRFPNYRATDHTVQATDAAIIVVKASSFVTAMERSFEGVKNSYEGKNAGFYNPMFGGYKSPIPTEIELAAINERTNRPIAVVLLTSKEHFRDLTQYESTLSKMRDSCAKFMKDIGDANNVRFFEIEDANKNKAELHNIMSLLLSDLQEGRGVHFSPPSIRPWDLRHAKKFETLALVEDIKLVDNNPPSLWSRFVNFVTGRA